MKNKIKYLPISILTITAAVSGAISPSVSAATTATSQASVTVPVACAFTSSATTEISVIASPGTSANTEGSGSRSISVTCNSSNALAIQAVGIGPNSSSPSTPVEGSNILYNEEEDTSIPSNTPSAAGASSYWAFKITSATTTTDARVTNNYANYSIVPTNATNAVTFSAAATTAPVSTISVRTDYQVQVAESQMAGTYAGGVKYLIVDGS